jgi:SOS-response transcriptional repressor LexA
MKPRDIQLLETIERLTALRGFAPTMREIATEMKVSLTRVAQLMEVATKAGRVVAQPKAARTCRVVRDAAAK